jgi:regulator of PEP synthase PpsR (kinase-PPPase family)
MSDEGRTPDELWADLTPEEREQVASDLEAISNELTPYQALVQQEQEAVLAAYGAKVAEIAATHPDITVDERFHRAVALADGDFDSAVLIYRQDSELRRQEALAALGIDEQRLADLRHNRAPADPKAELHRRIEEAVRRGR